MDLSTEELLGLSEPALIAAYADARRRFVQQKFARDTQRARLEWMRAKAFVNSSGNVTERNMAVTLSDELARKGQEVRELTRELDLAKAEVDVIDMVIRLRGAHGLSSRPLSTGHADEPGEGLAEPDADQDLS
ncbi:hypothetical protein LQG66_17405 [Bradyrhizobium ontarionense]|uniref:Uncharacterized protein n=1 Tax=Bradyrhizobium ontarionense TaxID=2898149 RepID=A0ABY3RN41_9BRAD|nr:hypothetical protein [Bradyrhizobium sp. A19]UFZ07964.1 hypothetical protein LQG66_17405 [Bradyrhizobium sp. A19]